ncbi:MAG: polyprenyl synthetase [Thermofilum sp. ex4484_15]|nr:MAG: polyprenyl synthetase [Thermofilum sp. ex4484_15]
MNALSRLKEAASLIEPLLEKYLCEGASEEFKEVILHQVRSGGKRLRPALTILSCEACGGKVEEALPVAAAVELIHNYSLIFDDIIDRGEIRRGLPTTYKAFGEAMAILAAVHYREAINDALSECKKPLEIQKLFSKAIKKLVEGERLDILFERAGREDEYIVKKRYREVTLDDYFKMIEYKTATLIEVACEAGALIADAPIRWVRGLANYGKNLGIAFQIVDDILDIFGEEREFGKKVGKDIIEHKLGNIVILLGLTKGTREKEALLSILSKEEIRDEEVRKAISMLEDLGVREEAYKYGERFVAKAKESLRTLPPSKAKEDLITLADFTLKRRH